MTTKVVDKFWNILGAQTTRNQKKSLSVLEQVKKYRSQIEEYSDDELRDKLQDLNFFQANIADQTLWCALISEASFRALGLSPFDTQLQGVLRLLTGDIVQMATGEGKTLVGALAGCGYALAGRTVHIMGVNDYLARRDHALMRPLFNFLGLTSADIVESSSTDERRIAYSSQILYGAVHEFGFDVLRENQILCLSESIMGAHDVVIIDEADSVLVDEALTPLVLAGSTFRDTQFDKTISDIVAGLESGIDFTINNLQGSVSLTERGATKVEEALQGINLYDAEHVSSTLISVNLALQAHFLTFRDVHYVVRDNSIKLINASRGRIAELQRWPDGLQEAVEIKENLSQTDTGAVRDSITIQALIKLYTTICGMTGTAIAAGEQFRQFYDLAISPVEPHKTNIRVDKGTQVYDTKSHKAQALIEHIISIHETGQPILIGTHDVAESEELADLLQARGLEVQVLNAKNDSQEAEIIANSGKKFAITVSTQMAGRGTDIKLGGVDADESTVQEIAALGGLYVIGTGLHETARLDDQLRGRAGRQGDPGTSIFFASLEDPLITRYTPITKTPHGIKEDGLVPKNKGNNYLHSAQKISEGLRLEAHANTWKYNEILNKQREVFSQKRYDIIAHNIAWKHLLNDEPEKALLLLEREIPLDILEQTATEIALYNVDKFWSEHLEFASEIQASIHLRALGNESPLQEYTKIIMEAFADFSTKSWEAVREMFVSAKIDEQGVHLSEINQRRNLHTWTYMVYDNPFTSSGSKLLSGIVGMFR